MSTPAQIAANRANSQQSTGAKTEAGKAAAARNNFRHGLATSSEFWVLSSESQHDYLKLLAELQQKHQPATPTEEALVQAMAEHHWLRHRAMRLEESCNPQTGAPRKKKERHKWELSSSKPNATVSNPSLTAWRSSQTGHLIPKADSKRLRSYCF